MICRLARRAAYRLERLEEALVVHAVLERHVERVVAAVALARVLEAARAWEEVTEAVEGQRHHAVGEVERLLDAVAVVHVDVHVEHAVLVLEQLEDR